MNKINKLIGSLLLSAFMLVGVGVSVDGKEAIRGDAAVNSYEKVSSLNDGDKILITSVKNNVNYYIPTNNGNTKAPTASSINIANNTIAGDYDANLFTLEADGANWKFNSAAGYLYTTSTNNGVRIGTNTNNSFIVTTTTNGFKMQNVGTKRYIGIYNTQDWRCYQTSNASNYGGSGEAINFYKVKVAISESPLSSITLSGQKTEYYVNDDFSFTGTCTATYEDGSSKEVTPTVTNEIDMKTAGTKTVNLSYTEGDVEKTASYDITVLDNPITSIEISGDMNKKLYSLNDSWNPEGLTVKANYLNGTQADVTSQVVWTYSPETANDLSITSVDVTATIGELSKSISVSDIKVLKSQKYDLQFNNGANGENANTPTNASDLKNCYVNENYSIIDVTNVTNGYQGPTNILKMGSGSKKGSITFTVLGNRKIVSSSFNLKTYGTDKTSVSINGNSYTLTNSYVDYMTAYDEGVETITLEAKNASDNRFFIYSASFEIIDGDEIAATTFAINDKPNSLSLNSTIELTTTIEPANTTQIVSWSASIDNIVTLTPSGTKNENCTITSTSISGQVTITATIGSLSDSFTLDVHDVTIPVQQITLNKTEITLYEQQSFQLEATITPSNATNKEILWVDNNNTDGNISISDTGLLKALKATTTPAEVHAVSLENDNIFAICTVTVLPSATYDRILDTADLHVGDEIIIGATGTNKKVFLGKDAGNNRGIVTNDNENVVDEDELIVYDSLLNENVAKFLVVDGTVKGTYSLLDTDTTKNGFLSIPSGGKNNYLKTTADKSTLNDLYFTASISDDNKITNEFRNSETEVAGETRYVRFNSSANAFASYLNNGQSDIAVYRLSGEGPSSKFYEEAETWSYDLFGKANCNINGTNDLTNEIWNSLKDSYKALSNSAQLFIKYKLYDPIPSGQAIEHDDFVETAVNIYEYVVAKYGYEDFMSRNPSKSINSNTSLINISSNKEIIGVITIISLVSITSIGGYFFIRKRKEQ